MSHLKATTDRWSKPSSDRVYNFLKPLVRFALKRYYRHIGVSGQSNFPSSGAVIVISNHQNAMMDPLLISCFTPRPLVWMARADVFHKKRLAWLLNALKMIPVYRSRDKVNLAEASARTQRICVDKLNRGEAIALFPEGTHRPVRHLFPFKKGFARIVIEAVAHTDVYIVPVGLDYSNFFQQQGVAHVRVGKPLLIKKGSTPSLVQLIDEAHQALQSVMIHADHQMDAAAFEEQRYTIAEQHWQKANGVFTWDNELDHALAEASSWPVRKSTRPAQLHSPSFLRLCRKMSVPGLISFLLLIMSLPAGLWSMPVLAVCVWAAKTSVADPMFYSSIRFLAGWLLFPIAFLLTGLALLAFMPVWQTMLILAWLILFQPVFWRIAPVWYQALRRQG
ncbi:MAG: 1-acyl-sn-glycerol-3-phosphate acyltransferase [Flavobacteriales bacterium]|nr:1-acyl-sn-glycerol-3-phosphate acyltransferase [Flavobacteriales bacterium]